jgi:MFS superfamily sulfate permease-like transporter
MQQNSANLPVLFTGWKGFKQNWKNDLVAGLSVALVALPLSLAIASSAGVPPVFGLVSVAIGGLVTTFVRGSHVAINGPERVSFLPFWVLCSSSTMVRKMSWDT